MLSLWVSYLFSLSCRASLAEFLRIQELVASGVGIFDPALGEGVEAWAEIRATQAHLLCREQYLLFCHEIDRAREAGLCFTQPGEPDFPAGFLNLQEVPFFLCYMGTPVWKTSVGLAVVGSREPSADSESWCEKELSLVLQQLSIFTVSGGARGIDQVCHRVSVRLRLPTVAILPSGLQNIYPPSLIPVVNSLLESGGALLSEYLPKTEMAKNFFQRRNRLIAGLAQICLIVEARRRSGTLITAQQAVEQAKPLFILPTHPYDPRGMGGLDLLLDGATPVRDAQDLISFLSAELKGVLEPKQV